MSSVLTTVHQVHLETLQIIPMVVVYKRLRLRTRNPIDFFDELDHVALKERQRMLLSRQMLGSTKTSLEGNTIQLKSPAVGDLSKQSSGIVKEEMYCGVKEVPSIKKYFCKIKKASTSSLSYVCSIALLKGHDI
ncbi:hypothetical protein ACH5RR_012111 [Cinchona calisaya]|uniref:Uncharacterized protein n=1 Tax=Cinchona calisaya TaxID=153742 RepID=A0ABD3AA88_9GENT